MDALQSEETIEKKDNEIAYLKKKVRFWEFAAISMGVLALVLTDSLRWWIDLLF